MGDHVSFLDELWVTMGDTLMGESGWVLERTPSVQWATEIQNFRLACIDRSISSYQWRQINCCSLYWLAKAERAFLVHEEAGVNKEKYKHHFSKMPSLNFYKVVCKIQLNRWLQIWEADYLPGYPGFFMLWFKPNWKYEGKIQTYCWVRKPIFVERNVAKTNHVEHKHASCEWCNISCTWSTRIHCTRGVIFPTCGAQEFIVQVV